MTVPHPHFQLARIRPRADTDYISQGRLVLSTGLDGFVWDHPDQGLIAHQTRMLSRYKWFLGRDEFHPVTSSNVQQHSALSYYIAFPPGHSQEPEDTGSGEVENASQYSLELKLARFVSEAVHEDVELTNFTQEASRFTLALEVDGDFRDYEELRHKRRQRGRLTKSWRRNAEGRWEFAFDYRAQHRYDHQGNRGVAKIHRGIAVQVERSDSPPRRRGSRIEFDVELAPRATWRACIALVPHIEGERFRKFSGCPSFEGLHTPLDAKRQRFLERASRFTTDESETLTSVVVGALNQAQRDLATLRLHDLDHADDAWTVSAGLPLYIALFGRDTLTAGWESALLSPEIMRGTLLELPRWQGTEVNDWRDEQPGKMLHEAHDGPLPTLGFNPRSRYYGAVTTSVFYPVVLTELWHWTGDKALVRSLLGPALRGLRWADQYGDLDHDGLYEYLSRSAQGTQNQGWKDSGDAIVYEDGSQVRAPIGTCEEQAYVYAAKLDMSELLWWLDEKDLAKRMFREAQELKQRFLDAYWLPDLGYIAMARDSDKRAVGSIGSDAGHCLACGIVEAEQAVQITERMFQPDLFTGWGMRTLSAKHPAFDPYAYHRGTVWPVEHGAFAIGFMRYGLHDALHRLLRGMFDAAALFDFYRLPEVFSGHQRDAHHPFPALYPKTCWPQAWSASSLFTMVQALLGIYPYAPLHTLFVDPHLPDWLPDITVDNLHVGEATVRMRFFRDKAGKSDYEVQEKRGKLHIIRQPSPWSVTAGWVERTRDFITSLLPKSA